MRTSLIRKVIIGITTAQGLDNFKPTGPQNLGSLPTKVGDVQTGSLSDANSLAPLKIDIKL